MSRCIQHATKNMLCAGRPTKLGCPNHTLGIDKLVDRSASSPLTDVVAASEVKALAGCSRIQNPHVCHTLRAEGDAVHGYTYT